MTLPKKEDVKKFFLDWELIAHWLGRIVMGIMVFMGTYMMKKLDSIESKLNRFDTYIEVHDAEYRATNKANDKEHAELRLKIQEAGSVSHKQDAVEEHEKLKDWVDKYFLRKTR